MEQTHIATISECAACGTSPVNHRLTFAMTIVDTVLESTMGFLFGWINLPRDGRFMNIALAGIIGAFQIVGLARYSTDRTHAVSGRSELIWEEAAARGIRMEQIVMFGKYLEQYRAKVGGHWIYFQSIPVPPWLPQKGYAWVDDKFKLAKKLRAANIASPRAEHVSTMRGAERAFEKMQKPLIIKPRSGSRGRHTTTNIGTIEELRAAFRMGHEIAPSLVIEEHLFGSVYRATVIDKKLVGFFRADPPRVTGDGTHTVSELIEKQNAAKHEKIQNITVTDDVRSFIARKGYALDSILPAGLVLDLTAKTGRFLGGYTKEMLPEVHPKMHEIFARAGKTAEIGIAGFDLIIPDPTQDPDTQVWGIIECNSLPFIDLHYYALEGTPINLAKNIWDVWEKKYPSHSQKV